MNYVCDVSVCMHAKNLGPCPIVHTHTHTLTYTLKNIRINSDLNGIKVLLWHVKERVYFDTLVNAYVRVCTRSSTILITGQISTATKTTHHNKINSSTN